MMLQAITVYRPCFPFNIDTNSTYVQHARYYTVHNTDKCHREAFFDDLLSECSEWVNMGDQFIIMADLSPDADEDVSSHTISSRFDTVGLKRAIIITYPKSALQPTWNREKNLLTGFLFFFLDSYCCWIFFIWFIS